MPNKQLKSIKRMRQKNKRKQSMAERRRKSLLRKQVRSKIVMYKRNDQLLISEFRQKLRIQKLMDIKNQVEYTMQPALLISTLKNKINKATREAINTEVQNTLNFVYTARSIIEKMFVRQKIGNESEVSRAETDSENAKRWVARIYLLFKSFDFDQEIDMSKYLPPVEEQDQPVREDAKLLDIQAEEQRYLGQKKSLKMEIEDNEIRLIAKEQILRERILEQQQMISDLNRQIMDLKRRMGLLPTVSSVRYLMSRMSIGASSKPQTQKTQRSRKKSTANILVLRQ